MLKNKGLFYIKDPILFVKNTYKFSQYGVLGYSSTYVIHNVHG